MHDEWTDRLSEYIDGELPEDERARVESHLAGCAACTATLHDLTRIVEEARGRRPLPPREDLWPGIAERIGADGAAAGSLRAGRAARRVTFTMPQLAAAAVLLAAISGSVAWRLHPGVETGAQVRASAPVDSTASRVDRQSPAPDAPDVRVEPVSLSDAQYDAAVADLERALSKGRGRLDKTTIAIVEENLQIIDQAIGQAREALAADPANSYLSGHLVEARRKKLDLLRRATALTTDTN